MILEETKIIKVSENVLSEKDIENLKFAADVIKKGGLVVFPTETVYGLGANALNENAAKAIYAAKGRPSNNPLIIHLDDKQSIEKYCYTENVYGFDVLSELMPAPLTIILKAKPCIPKTVTGGLDTVAVRVPENAVARKLIEFSGVPIAAPSANISGKPSPTCIEHVIEDMYGRVDVIIDGGNCRIGVESTIVTLDKEIPTLLRPGGITYEMLLEKLGEVEISKAVLDALKPGEVVLSPGLMYKHYAPEAPLELIKGDKTKAIEYVNESCKKETCAVICYKRDMNLIRCDNVLCVEGENEYACKIFALLRETNRMGINKIFAFLPDDTSGISLAVYNRLLRAAGFNVKEF